jgi:Kef-type K+ transport system membrane component KefB
VSVALGTVLRRDRAIIGAGLGGLVLLAWLYLLRLARAMPGKDAAMGMAIPQMQAWNLGDFWLLVLMWTVMMVAMMVPTAIPMIMLIARVDRRHPGRPRPLIRTGVFVSGYLTAWTGYSMLAAGSQWALHAGALLSPAMATTSRYLAATILFAAGVYQWTPLKRACLAGFEVDPLVFRRKWRTSLGVGVLSFLAPLVGVYAVCRGAFGTSVAVAGLLGIGLSTTSLALVYHFLRERDVLRGDAGQTVLGAAMVVDVLSMLSLAVLLGRLGWASVVLVAAAVPTFWGLPRLGRWLFARYRGSVVEFELRFLLTLLVGFGFLADHAGIHAAVASFVAGLVLSEVVQDHETLEEKLKGVVFSFFAPVFFLRAGTQLDLRGLDWATLGATVVLFAIATGLKYLGTAGAARLCGLAPAHFAGVIFNYRLTFGIITASVGVEEGLLDSRWFSVVLLVVLGSAVLPMVLLRDLPAELDR